MEFWMFDVKFLIEKKLLTLSPLRSGRSFRNSKCGNSELALLRSVSVNLAELRRAPAAGGLVALLRSEPRGLGRSYEGFKKGSSGR